MAKNAKSGPKVRSTRAFEVSGDINRIVPLNEGKHAYVRTLDGRTCKVATDSEEFGFIVADLVAEGFAERIKAELAALGWTNQLARFERQGFFGYSPAREIELFGKFTVAQLIKLVKDTDRTAHTRKVKKEDLIAFLVSKEVRADSEDWTRVTS